MRMDDPDHQFLPRRPAAAIGEDRFAAFIGWYRDGFIIQAVLLDLGDTLLHFEAGDKKKLHHAIVRPVYDGLSEMGYQPPAYEACSRVAKWQWISRRSKRETCFSCVTGLIMTYEVLGDWE